MSILERGNPAPFTHWRGPVGCLLLHGFPGTPAEMRLLGEYLAERGISVMAPLLAGHGTIPEDLRRVRWHDWVATAEAAFARLSRRCHPVFLCGLSVGGAITFYLAPRLPAAGVVALAPAMRLRDRHFEWAHLLGRVISWVNPTSAPDDLADPRNRALTWHYQRYPGVALAEVLTLVQAARRSLPRIQVPVLIFQSPRDGLLDPEGARWAYSRIGSVEKELVWLQRSGHNIAVDVEREEVFARVAAFVRRVAGSQTPPREEGAPRAAPSLAAGGAGGEGTPS